MEREITFVHFSPTGGSYRAGLLLARSLGQVVEEVDLTQREERAYSCPPDHVAVLAGPVYGGRMPALMMERLSRVTGNGAWAVAAAVYGNRAWEDGLAELGDVAEARGFRILGGAALVSKHSIVTTLAAARPDALDEAEIAGFGRALLDKLAAGGDPVTLPGDRPYRAWSGMPAFPTAEQDRCTACGLCAAECPAGAIAAESPWDTDGDKCIRCMRCVAWCPQEARVLPAAAQAASAARLAPFQNVRGCNRLFL